MIVFIITGMHRTGTSLVARLFYESGADMGNADEFYRPDKWNPDGYFEQPDIHAINMPLINGPWWKFSYFYLPSTETILNRAKKRATQIKQIAARYQGKVVKETRYCLTLPAWSKYGAKVDRILVCLRDPVQVARSIQKRNFTTLNHGFNLWYIHNSRLLENAEHIPMWFIYYNNLLDEQDYFIEMKGAFQFFGYDFPDETLAQLQKKCVKPQMNHNPEQTDIYPRKVAVLWQELLERHKKQRQVM